jgi:hypothetical protein
LIILFTDNQDLEEDEVEGPEKDEEAMQMVVDDEWEEAMEDAAHKGMEAMDKALEEEDDDRSK